MGNFNFNQRRAVIATMHQKERAIAPILERELGIRCIVPPDFNTDRFGTFTRDIKRWGNQLETAKVKADRALDCTGETLALASEGSFFPHPTLWGLTCNRELIVLRDRPQNLTIIGFVLTTETNFSHRRVETVSEALEFAHSVGFPEHGLVVMFDKESQSEGEIFKGIVREETLCDRVEFVLNSSRDRTAHLETDMRALYNPTRMKAIEQATLDLVKKIQQTCPNCTCPGFDIVKKQKGLPCQICMTPTDLIIADIYQCQHCQFKKEVLFPNGNKFSDPTFCPTCNP